MQRNCILLLILIVGNSIYSQCVSELSDVNSPRTEHYDIKVQLDNEKKFITADQKLLWVNHSDVPIEELRFYMYFNSFKNTESTFLISAEGNIFGDDISDRPEASWGWIEVTEIQSNGVDLSRKAKYIQPDDNNTNDQSVLSVPLEEPLLPGDSITLDMKFEAKIPMIFARAGYQREDFYNMVHWFPQLGVLELRDSLWQWNCHQFHRRTEFFGEFGVYDVSITLPDHFEIGASGCLVNKEQHDDGNTSYHFHAEDVIDFAWSAYPNFLVVEDEWQHVAIRLLIAPEHKHLSDRIIRATKHSLEYLSENLGLYPYNTITLMNPPFLGLRSGFMEYPTFITLGSFAVFPEGIRTLESLVAHEFTHQYFMGILANNEKEEPWLDEGFVTYHEDKIMESMYDENCSLFDIGGYKVGNSSFSRQEYTSLSNPSVGAIARQGWEIKDGFKGITYSKTATVLKTLEGLLGAQNMKQLLRSYYAKFKFTHPRAEDFIGHATSFINNSDSPNALGQVDVFFDQLIYGTEVCDYAVDRVSFFKQVSKLGIYDKENQKVFSNGIISDTLASKIVLYRKGGVIIPVEVLVKFEDGTSVLERWDGVANYHELIYKDKAKVSSVQIDPEKKIYIDINLNNNSYQVKRNKTALLKVSSKVMYWVSQAVQSLYFTI